MTELMLKYFRTKQQEVQSQKVYDTQCPFCSMQCKMQLIEQRVVSRRNYKTVGKDNPTTNGRLCIKGMSAHQHALHHERIKQPMLKVDGEFVPITWKKALGHIREKYTAIQREDGLDALSVYGSASLTNEEAYLLGKFARVALKTKHIDYNGRLCMASAATGANQTFGMDRGFTNTLQEVPYTRCIILAGTNLAECQPTAMPYFEKAKENGAFIIAIDPRETATTKAADLHLKNKPGTDAALANGLLKILIEEQMIDQSFIQKRVNGFEEVREYLSSIEIEEIESITDLSKEELYQAASIFGQEESGMIFTARGIEQQTDGTAAVRGFLNILLATGKIGKANSGYGAITGQGNGQGAREHGQKADQLPGYRSIEKEEDRAYISKVWGVEEKDLPGKGVSAYEMFEKAYEGTISGMFIMCSNPVVSHPNSNFVEKALKNLKSLIVVDMFISETAKLADLILPASSYLEDQGTMTNVEGRVTLREANRPLPGNVKHDWQIICDMAKVLGKGDYFSFTTAEEIFDELRVASRGGKADYFGITYEKLRKEDGILWPCPSVEHRGTKRLFEDSFAHKDGRAKMAAISNLPRVPKQSQSKKYPLLLTTGRVMSQYLTGEQTRKSSTLVARNFESFMEIHPHTAKKYQLEDHSVVKVESKTGHIKVRCKWSMKTRKDTVFVPFHWVGTQNVNKLVSDDLDPSCKMPGFKVIAVRVSKASSDGNEEMVYPDE
ncbi:assimilatory nitrate reductase catalytic subunit NasC [Halobacillus karajensis]|uniref:Assimilatory nitrate reductase catalytic subunit n=1 Tax=Halobacillus karajensis TaxID=195088 RepID=A0A024P4T0_9BACI|nr:nitrate reductase [Halobacillus karajensis]CDQ20762.1 Assimilatory nitrate reductase catalytic subunit [Halobacillus karajensis]CDQ23768.1 Assimilatory nitrate reductase catalytic subunit [Halobacillus karajensis]CDQ27246.1 Assimilatory nitrate reductase catalytic subunit [Halobacillus karajensis]